MTHFSIIEAPNILNDRIMPAVDYRLEGGLEWDELSTLLKASMHSGQAVGVNIGIYNPSLDEDGSIARRFVKTLVEGLLGGEHGERY